jgi:hypothetical protein
LILKKKPNNLNNNLIIREKEHILNLISKTINKKITTLSSIFYTCKCKFGNLLVILNKLLFFSEIIGCRLIILDKEIFWFIKNRIIIKESNITIEVDEKKKYYNDSLTIFYDSDNIFYSIFEIKPEIRINYIRNEILNNLPKTITSKNDLYIHIRSGDIFLNPHYLYAQPPLCFYQSIIKYYHFNKIYLISQDKTNPVITKLIKENSNIIFGKNDLSKDISYLINAYNIVASISSFLNSIIQLNYNLKFLWDYNIYRISEKALLYHYDLYKFPIGNFTIYRMEATSYYKNIMYTWKNNRKQKKLMIKEKCINYFMIINNK